MTTNTTKRMTTTTSICVLPVSSPEIPSHAASRIRKMRPSGHVSRHVLHRLSATDAARHRLNRFIYMSHCLPASIDNGQESFYVGSDYLSK